MKKEEYARSQLDLSRDASGLKSMERWAFGIDDKLELAKGKSSSPSARPEKTNNTDISGILKEVKDHNISGLLMDMKDNNDSSMKKDISDRDMLIDEKDGFNISINFVGFLF